MRGAVARITGLIRKKSRRQGAAVQLESSKY